MYALADRCSLFVTKETPLHYFHLPEYLQLTPTGIHRGQCETLWNCIFANNTLSGNGHSMMTYHETD